MSYPEQLEALLGQAVYELPQAEKEQQLGSLLLALHRHHQLQCNEYSQLYPQPLKATENMAGLPYLAVRLFKLLDLKSVADDEVLKCLSSSGTTGQIPARIYLDAVTSRWQSKTLVKILQQFLGKQRLPMLIIDCQASHMSGAALNARSAGIQGLAMFGRNHTYALNADMSPNWAAIDAFCAQHQHEKVLIFGFTFMVWQYFVKALQQQGRSINLPQGHLFHSGGWKKLQSESVDNATFKQGVEASTGIQQVTNFYGMAEQVGTVFMECSHGYLHAPATADVIMRNCFDLSEQPTGEQGLIQVLSALPFSYPGFSLLTEDLGTVHGVDDCECGRKGKYFTVQGRLPKVELRGCSDTAAAAV
ncbi:acyl-protein synthetase [Alteromonas lipolytica]|uniref:Acyl-protein synthetase n=2 Tax=Alteromonas lipolytica TaxID=1856405 RepID=A0A1E8FHV7_9ALTE|nr:acyl-protein synthetase [Alteromonas lipolytica]